MTSVRPAPAEWLAQLPAPDGKRSVLAFEHGTLSSVKSSNLAVWVMYYGPEGGEKPD